jgi:hypothetical protein
VAQYRIEAKGEEASHLVGVRWPRDVPDEVDAAVQLVQSSTCEAVTDLMPRDALVSQLPPRDDAVMARRQAGYQPVNTLSA